MVNGSDLLKELFDYLNAEVRYAVLRNYEELPDANNSRDIDIMIPRREFAVHRRNIVRIIGQLEYKIVTCLKSDRLVTYVCGKREGGDVALVQLDFFFDTSVFGVELMPAERVVASRQFNGRVYHVSKEYEFLDKFMYNMAVGHGYPEKYAQVRDEVGSSEAVASELRRTFGEGSLEKVEAMKSGKLLRKAFCQGLRRRPCAQAASVVKFLWSFTGNYLCSRTGFTIGFTGPDGSGKTTVIETLHSAISPVFSKAFTLYHSRPEILPNIGEVVHSSGLAGAPDRDYQKPHRGGKTSVLSSLMRLSYYSIDYIAGYFLKVKPLTRITQVVVFDRYYTDFIADSRRSRIHLGHKFLYSWGRVFIPSLDYNILLTADRDMILSRKRELDAEGIDRINSRLMYLATKRDYYLVMNNGTPAEAVGRILDIIFEAQHRKNIARIV